MVHNYHRTIERPAGNIRKVSSIQARHKILAYVFHINFNTYFAKNGVFLRTKFLNHKGNQVIIWFKQDPTFITLKGEIAK